MDITLICDPIIGFEGSNRPAIFLAEDLADSHNVSVLSPFICESTEKALLAKGVTPINLRLKFFTKKFGPSVLWLEAWMREAFLKLNSRSLKNKSTIVINFSNVVSIPSKIWYLQGPPSKALEDMEKEFSYILKFFYRALQPFVRYADERLIEYMSKCSSMIIANSKFCASVYSLFGVHVDDVVYPPIDLRVFQPSTSNPSSDYILTYLGKETRYSVLKKLAGTGVKIKAFGSKTPFLAGRLKTSPNIEFLGRLSIKELVDVYSNALFTVFPFSHEPFGYIPLESIACGTPVLTYGFQGPGEYIINGLTGWLVESDEELVKLTLWLWKNGYPPRMRIRCVKEASKFDVKFYVGKWREILGKMNGEEFKG